MDDDLDALVALAQAYQNDEDLTPEQWLSLSDPAVTVRLVERVREAEARIGVPVPAEEVMSNGSTAKGKWDPTIAALRNEPMTWFLIREGRMVHTTSMSRLYPDCEFATRGPAGGPFRTYARCVPNDGEKPMLSRESPDFGSTLGEHEIYDSLRAERDAAVRERDELRNRLKSVEAVNHALSNQHERFKNRAEKAEKRLAKLAGKGNDDGQV